MLPTNNLGRSVSKTNAARIRKAWAHAADRLDGILAQVAPPPPGGATLAAAQHGVAGFC